MMTWWCGKKIIFLFEYMNMDGGETFKWNDRKINLRELKGVMSKMADTAGRKSLEQSVLVQS